MGSAATSASACSGHASSWLVALWVMVMVYTEPGLMSCQTDGLMMGHGQAKAILGSVVYGGCHVAPNRRFRARLACPGELVFCGVVVERLAYRSACASGSSTESLLSQS